MVTVFLCKDIGVAGSTDCHVKRQGDKFIARIGICLLGMSNMDEDGFKACNHDPFHPEFYDNFAEGSGDTQEEAIIEMKKDMSAIGDTLWM